MTASRPQQPDKQKKHGKGESEVQLPASGEELLSLLGDYGMLEKSSALREMKLTPKGFDDVVDRLSKDGWVTVYDRDLENYSVELTKKSHEWIEELKEKKKEEEGAPEIEQQNLKTGAAKHVSLPKASLHNRLMIPVLASVSGNVIDLAILMAFFLTLYLIVKFIGDPNQRIMDFLAAMVLFSVVLLVYHNSKQRLKTTTLLEKVMEFLSIMLREGKTLLFAVFLVLIVYFVGWAFLYSEHRVLSIILCTIVLSSIIQLYNPIVSVFKVPLFYVGMILIVYSMLVIFGVARITDLLFGAENRVIDVLVGIGMLALVYINRGFLGVRITYFREMIEREDRRSSL